jgi:transposase
MRFIGIDVGAERHFIAALSEEREVLQKATGFSEDALGHARLFELIGERSDDVLVGMEATGHYWKNVYAALVEKGFAVVVLNPLRTKRFAEADLERTKTDKIDAMSIARFLAEKRPAPTRLTDDATERLKEQVRLRDRFVQDLGDRVRQLHRMVDLGFPEFTRFVKDLSSPLATRILKSYPTAEAFRRRVLSSTIARLKYGAKSKVGEDLAKELIAAAKVSVGRHHGGIYDAEVKYFAADIEMLRARIAELEQDINRSVDDHELGALFVSIDGIGPQTAARILAVVGDPAETFRNAAAFASYVGAIPGLYQSGKRTSSRASLTHLGHVGLRSKLYMPTLTAVRHNPWLRASYQRLCARGKLPKVALVACLRKLLHALYSVAKSRKPFELRVTPPEVPAV